ncbi:MAG TPA: lysine--tRNA ligase [Acidimicrobiia bacterium]|nr:lysine--tRNA ligase [Acidimicrobiia bacterium]
MTDHVEQEADPLVAARRERHALILESGGYPDRFERTDLAAGLRERFGELEPGSQTEVRVSVAGRLMLHRSFGKLQFGTLRDGSGSIQLLVDGVEAGDELADSFELVDLGDWLGATGLVMTTRKGELSVRVEELVVLQKSLRQLPDKWHGLQDLEQRSRHRYLDLMVNEEARQVAMTRTLVVSELRRQFEERGFVEVETPVLLAQATGATARPFRTEHHALGMAMYLRIATELHLKRLVVGGMERVFEIGRIFRNEGIDATHNPEFTMLEAYQALADHRDILKLVEEVFGAVTERAVGQTSIEFRGELLDLTPPYRQVTMTELVSETLGENLDLDTPIETLRRVGAEVGVEVVEDWSTGRLIAEIYEEVVEGRIRQPTFVTHPPIEVSPLARRNRDDPRLADRFELVIAGSEYANAFSELNDPDDQRARFEEQAAARAAGEEDANPLDEDYLLALEYGLPPTGGLGIGVDRLVMLLTDQAHIRDVILFPTLRPEA